MKIKLAFLFATSIAIFSGCGSIATVSVAPGYRAKAQRVAVLPFDVIGNPDVAQNQTIADHLAAVLMDAGISVIDAQDIVYQAKSKGINLSRATSDDLARLAEPLHIDAVFLGSIQYGYHGPESGVRPIDIHENIDTVKGKVIVTKSVSGGGSYSESGGYFIQSISTRLVSVKTSETLVTGYVPGNYEDALLNEVRKKLLDNK